METCQAIVGGRIGAYEGAHAIWWDAWPLISDQPEGDELAPFIGQATEWEEHPEVRGEIEMDILRRADDLVRRWTQPGYLD